jgi:hypothetical protein
MNKTKSKNKQTKHHTRYIGTSVLFRFIEKKPPFPLITESQRGKMVIEAGRVGRMEARGRAE